MHKFYLTTECTPLAQNLYHYANDLKAVLCAYNDLLEKKELNIDSGIITEKLPKELQVGEGFTLSDVIDSLPKELKNLAYSYFIKYPIYNYFDDSNDYDKQILDAEYTINIAQHVHEIINLAVVAMDENFGFTVPVHTDLEQNVLNFNSTKTATLELYNLYGKTICSNGIDECEYISNSSIIEDKINSLNAQRLSIFEQLMLLLYNPICHDRLFTQRFKAFPHNIQTTIFRKFKDAVTQNTIDYPDDNTVQDVTPSKAKCNVLELRIYTPIAIRIYFNKTNGIIYLGTIEHKSNSNQNKDINKAANILYTLIQSN